jgi:hypothetical protein
MMLKFAARQAKKSFDRRGGVEGVKRDLDRLTAQAKATYEQRGGKDGLKQDVRRVGQAARTPGAPLDKAQAMLDALKRPLAS